MDAQHTVSLLCLPKEIHVAGLAMEQTEFLFVEVQVYA